MSQQTWKQPSGDNLVQGGRRVYIKRSGEAYYTHIGYLEKADPTPDINTREVYNGYDGSEQLIKRRTNIRSVKWDIVSLERTLENLRFWYQGGTKSSWTQSADEVLVGDSEVASGCLIGVSAYTDVVAKVWYPISACDANKTRVHRLNKAVPPTFGSLVEGTDFYVDYENGMVAFAAVLASDVAVTLNWLAVSGSSFAPWYFAGIDNVVAEIMTVGEEGDIIEVQEIPKARLETAGTDSVTITDDSKINLSLVQMKHATSGWGTYRHADVG
jgi:hypothetical protein